MTDRDITLTIGEVDRSAGPGGPIVFPVTLRNGSGQPVEARFDLAGRTPPWVPGAPTSQGIRVEAGREETVPFQMVATGRVFQALYPAHVRASCTVPGNGSRFALEAVRVFEATSWGGPDVVAAETEPATLELVRQIRLEETPAAIVWNYDEQPERRLPLGWQGQEPTSRTTMAVHPVDRAGDTRPALSMHPPYQGGPGTVCAEYRVRLPDRTPIVLTFANAIRDHHAGEPASDGVTFRIWVDGETVFNRHTADKTWLAGSVDLSPWATMTIRLRLESHPGPNNDTTCDSSFWAEPTLWAGPLPRPARAETQWQSALATAVTALSPSETADEIRTIGLADGGWAVVVEGPRPGEGVIGLATGGETILFRGLDIAIDGKPLYSPRSGYVFDPRTRHFHDEHGSFALKISAHGEGPGLRLSASVSNGRRITDLALGPADRRADRVYFGHGYRIRDPQRFRVGFGGHTLSASHVGMDFDNGLSLVVASDLPPVAFAVDPDRKRYALHTRGNATFTLVPGTRGALDCAIRYRPLYDKPAAAGVAAKAGRFVFDLWGGQYREHRDWMEQAVRYGLTQSLLTIHTWQRWGYDYRLPDIYPPNPQLGSLDDLRDLSAYCRAQGIPWGLHDNYIDFYPDATGFDYDHICFTPNGHPVRAWLNEYRQAQSYRWRPDHILPFVRRNLDQIAPALTPTHSFVDVFTSLPPIEFHDRQGEFHPAEETRRHWNQAFDTIRTALASPAITTSEAGHDQLTGHLDGADCQFLRLTDSSERFTIAIPCADWVRVPWYDAVLHDRFVLHGVGYSSRYQSSRPRFLHGIESDDYISAEILTGHALMTDRTAGLTGAVRKYWLAQPWVVGVAMDTLRSVTFAGDDPGRQIVHWTSGATAHVNRGSNDWVFAGHTLPPFGFRATTGQATSTVERIAGRIVEHASWPGGRYVNARTRFPLGPLAVRPMGASLEPVGPETFRLFLDWKADEPLPIDAMVFVHFLDPASKDRNEGIAFQGDHRPGLPKSEWAGPVRTGGHRVRLPPGLAPGRYPILTGLYAPTGSRFSLLGDDADNHRYRVGTLVVAANTLPALEPHRYDPPESPLNPAATMIDFGDLQTDGAFRLTTRHDHQVLTPLPESPATRVVLRGRPIGRVLPITASFQPGPALPIARDSAGVSFATRAGVFAYRLEPPPPPRPEGSRNGGSAR